MTEAEFGRFGRLAEATEDFRALADAMPQLVWTARSDGTIDYFNRRWVEYTGTVLEEIGGRDRALGVVHPDDLRETWARWEVAVASAAPYEMEYRLRGAADGSYRWFLARATPLCDERGQVVRWIGTATDIDDQHRSRDALQFLVEAG
ncbi:MAG TPA: PAS domain-containing protein, partial [Candidatus Acidoferrales bacterium]|nr:PAS domain-containing protein [Candidatus Acidoferrales bacterium]